MEKKMTDLCKERFDAIIKHFERKKKIHSDWIIECNDGNVCIMLKSEYTGDLLVLCTIFYETDFVKYKYNHYHIIINYDTNRGADSYMYYYEKTWTNQDDVIFDLRNRLLYSKFISKKKRRKVD